MGPASKGQREESRKLTRGGEGGAQGGTVMQQECRGRGVEGVGGRGEEGGEGNVQEQDGGGKQAGNQELRLER